LVSPLARSTITTPQLGALGLTERQRNRRVRERFSEGGRIPELGNFEVREALMADAQLDRADWSAWTAGVRGIDDASVTSVMLWSVDSAARGALHEQIAANVRRAVADGALVDGERLPPATELADALGVNANTVLQAYRQLREEGVLEFRRGRGVRVCAEASNRASVLDAAVQLLAVGRSYGYTPSDLARLLTEL
jgi:DNA-binding transcriptional regulator YhcF (GntR family)